MTLTITLNAIAEPIRCSHCGAVTTQPKDVARQAGWRIGWRPDHPCWCPPCFGADVQIAQQRTTSLDTEPIWETE